MDDLISRQKAKDAIDMALDHIDHVPSWVYDKLLNALNEVPPVQSELSNNSKELENKNGELISRQDAIDGVKTLHDVAWKNWHEPTLSANVVLDMIRGLPSAQPKERCVVNITLNEEDIERIVAEQVEEIKELLPQKGEWICQADDDIWNCSECDYEIDGTGCIDPLEYLKTYKFCPNCGCCMEEGE